MVGRWMWGARMGEVALQQASSGRFQFPGPVSYFPGIQGLQWHTDICELAANLEGVPEKG